MKLFQCYLVFAIFSRTVLTFMLDMRRLDGYVSLHHTESESYSVLVKGPYGICSGTLISETHVLTAAHCMIPGDECLPIQEVEAVPENFTVFALGTCHSTPENPCPRKQTEAKPFNVTELCFLENFFEKCTTSDIAILKLSIPPGHKKLPHAWFYNGLNKPNSGSFSVAGWGYDPINPENTGVRMSSAKLNVVPCREPRYDQMCVEEVNTDACEGDSGAGILRGSYIYGVVSYGEKCDDTYQKGLLRRKNPEMKTTSNTNGVFTYLNAHKRAICDIIQTENCKITDDSVLDDPYTCLPFY